MSNCALWGRLVLLVGLAVGMAACTASKDITQAQQQLRQVEDFRTADMDTLAKPLGEYRKDEEDEVLFHLEHGMLEHFQQDWNQSSKHFRQAQRAIKDNYTKSINRNVQSMLVNDLQLPYRGEAYEDIYLNAIKGLNYLHQDDLEGAMVEVRKITHELEMLSDRYKGLAESLQRDTAQAAVKKVDERLEDVDLLSEDEEGPIEIQQNSALGRFLTTVLYAKQGQPDDARIELQKLRTALEDQGHTEFLDALSQVASAREDAGTESFPERSTPQSETSLVLRATPEADTPLSALQVRVSGRTVDTVEPADMQQEGRRYSVRLTDVPAGPGDSVSIQPVDRPEGSLRLEAWSDSVRYRETVGAERPRATFVLGASGHQGGSRSQERQSTGTARTGWMEETPLQPVRMVYAYSRVTSADAEHFKAYRTLEPASSGSTPAWRLTEHVVPVFGEKGAVPQRRDTMYLDPSSLSLLRYSHQSTRGGMTVQRSGTAFVEDRSPWQQTTSRVEHPTTAYGEGMGVETALSTRSLSVGDVLTLPVYVSGRRAVQTINANVTRRDSVTTPAGTYSVYVVQVQAPSSPQGTTTLYLRESMPHHLVQAQTQIPVQQNERPDTLTLRRTLAHMETMEGAVSESSPRVASRTRGTPEPPESPPTLAVASASANASQATSTANALTPTPQQLTAANAYNTLLISFSGRAPKKKERSFTFNFTIDEEEYELNFAIPVLELTETDVERVRAIAAGDTVQVPLIEEMQQVAHAMFEEKKSIIYTRAVIRAFLKAAATKGVEELAESQGGAGAAWLAKQAGQMASGYVAEADTRGWQTMPGFAYATVANLPPGTQEVTFEYVSAEGEVLKRRTRQVDVTGKRGLALAESIYLE